MGQDEDKSEVEIIAREIARLHGEARTDQYRTVASSKGYGSWPNFSELNYSRDYWEQYVGAAKAMIAKFGLPKNAEETQRDNGVSYD